MRSDVIAFEVAVIACEVRVIAIEVRVIAIEVRVIAYEVVCHLNRTIRSHALPRRFESSLI